MENIQKEKLLKSNYIEFRTELKPISEIQSVRLATNLKGNILYTGDTEGNIKIINILTNETKQWKAH